MGMMADERDISSPKEICGWLSASGITDYTGNNSSERLKSMKLKLYKINKLFYLFNYKW